MNSAYFVVAELLKKIEIPQRGILSPTLDNDDDVKVVLFRFCAGQELSEHTAPMPARCIPSQKGLRDNKVDGY